MLRQEDLFVTVDGNWGTSESINHEMLENLRKAPLLEHTDIECIEALTILLKNELINRGTGKKWSSVADHDFRIIVSTSVQVAHRIGLTFPKLPFRDLSGFEAYWKSKGMVGDGSWQQRRNFVTSLFDGFENEISDYLHSIPQVSLGDPLVISGTASWESIDLEVQDLRSRYASSANVADYNSVGLQCVRITELLAEMVFDEQRHLEDDVDPPHAGQTKNKFDLVIQQEFPGEGNHEIRKSMRSTIDLAQTLKHRRNPKKREVAIAADATILLVNMMRSLLDPQLD